MWRTAEGPEWARLDLKQGCRCLIMFAVSVTWWRRALHSVKAVRNSHGCDAPTNAGASWRPRCESLPRALCGWRALTPPRPHDMYLQGCISIGSSLPNLAVITASHAVLRCAPTTGRCWLTAPACTWRKEHTNRRLRHFREQSNDELGHVVSDPRPRAPRYLVLTSFVPCNETARPSV